MPDMWDPMHRRQDADIRLALDSLRRIVRALRLAASEVESSLHISVAQLFVLQQLSDGKPRSIGRLASEALTDPSSASVVVRRLVERKLVVRRPAADDARRVDLTLSAAGKRLLARAPELPQARLMAALGKVSARRRQALAASLDEVARTMGAGDPTLFFEEE